MGSDKDSFDLSPTGAFLESPFGARGIAADDPILGVPGKLFAGTVKLSKGGEVWSTTDGTSWIKENISGFGDPNNEMIQSMHLFTLDNRIYVGTDNWFGASLWRSADPITIIDFPQKKILILVMLFGFTIFILGARKVVLF